MSAAATLRIEVVYALVDRCWRVPVSLAAGARVADALAAADLPAKVPGLAVDPSMLAIFGRTATLASALHDGDRVEVLRPLVADPKQARRERAKSAGKA
ncbi:MAG TPA: RnfH family protein [Arenimonas sp.]|uniref:RnfH family protein n=1 Tax=Arenimonas sp. TaxID=1872635 RepID=UPI002D80232E|nr:RnfH family protein [Arenimonas sp.]HEU0153820.1 RnfH family protein [Arenimonas sp.]